METGANAWPRTAAAVIDGRTAPRLAGAIAGAWDAQPEPGGEPETAPHAGARESRTARAVAAAAVILAAEAALAIATRATESGERAAQPGRARGWFRGAPALAAPTSGPADGRNPGRGEQDMRSLVTAGATLAIGAAAQAQVGEPVQWRVEDGGNGHWYRFDPTHQNWTVTKAVAESEGGQFACIGSSQENAFVRALIPVGDAAYIGAIRETANSFRWVTGETWGFSGWNPGEPNGSTDEEVVWLERDSGGWNDHPQTADLQGSVIEWSADCNSNGIVDFGEIRAGQLPDQNANNVPDGCECAAHPDLDACCPGDLYRNGVVNGADLGILLAEWGEVTPTTTADLNRDGAVDGSDLGILLSGWGACPG